MKRSEGLTLIEVIIAVAIIATIMGALTTTVVSNIRRTSATNGSAQAAQLFNYLGRRVVGGDAAVLPDTNATLSWGYSELGGAFSDLAHEQGVADPKFFRASISNTGSYSFSGSSLDTYALEVCHNFGGGETCVTGMTMGPSPANASNPAFFLPGVN